MEKFNKLKCDILVDFETMCEQLKLALKKIIFTA